MKHGLRCLALAFTIISALTACGKQRVASSSFEKASGECGSSAMSNQFMIKRLDGGIEVVRAESQDEFINGYMTQNLKDIEYAEPDYVVHAYATARCPTAPAPALTTYADNWGAGYDPLGRHAGIYADAMWAQNVRGDGVVVAVIDTGADLTHPQLAAQIYVNPGESGLDARGHDKASNGIDDDNNGYIDDVNGYDFVNNARLTGDDNGHGTHVSGVIAGAHSDTVARGGSYVQGVAPRAKIMPLKFLDFCGEGSLSNGVRAIKYAAANGAQVINASWGGGACSRTLRDEIAALTAQNVAFVVAAGNAHQDIDLLPEFPAALGLDSQITVGAIGDHADMAHYSNYGLKSVHIFAPGTNIVSTWPGGLMAYDTGTSMATPFVTGAVALLRGVVPSATVLQIRAALSSSAAHSSEYINVSKGRMDLTTALSELHQITGH